MSLRTVREAAEFARAVGVSPRLRIVWHAGEPLVVGPSWYRESHRTLSEVLGWERLRFHFQSNGTLLSMEGSPHESSLGEMASSVEYEEFLFELFRLWLGAGRPFVLREVERIWQSVVPRTDLPWPQPRA